jgi:hypothetical protein
MMTGVRQGPGALRFSLLAAVVAVCMTGMLLGEAGRAGANHDPTWFAAALAAPSPVLAAVWLGRLRRTNWDSRSFESECPTIDALLRSQRLRRPWTATSLPAAGSWFFPPPKQRPLNLDAYWSEVGALSQPDVTLGLLVKAQRLRRPWPELPEETPGALLTPPAGSAQSR